MGSVGDVLSELDPILAEADVSVSPWKEGEFKTDMDLARRLLEVPIKAGHAENQRSGRVAKSLDAWIAHELRRAGFPEGSVWPRRTEPRVRPDDLTPAEDAIRVAEHRMALFEKRFEAYFEAAKRNGLRKKPPSLNLLRSSIRRIDGFLPGSANARILGRFYPKQVDVVMSSWEHGPELLISTKTQLSSYEKNNNNRYEEAVGEGLNLRERHPAASMGFAFLVRSNIFDGVDAWAQIRNRLLRLRKPHGFFDATMLVALDWDDETKALQPIEDSTADLTSSRFFKDLTKAVLDFTPDNEYRKVRELMKGEPTTGFQFDGDGSLPEEAAAHDAD
jgi:hypothetical protein